MTNLLVAGRGPVADAGIPASRGLVYDGSSADPQSWDELEALLVEVFQLTQSAAVAGDPVVYVVHEPSVWGHTSSLRAALATALLGAMRSAAVEGARKGLCVNAVALGEPAQAPNAAEAAAFLLMSELSGQLLTCGTTHLGRPPV